MYICVCIYFNGKAIIVSRGFLYLLLIISFLSLSDLRLSVANFFIRLISSAVMSNLRSCTAALVSRYIKGVG